MFIEILLASILTLFSWWAPFIGPFFSGFITTYLSGSSLIRGFAIGLIGGLISIVFMFTTVSLLNPYMLESLGILISLLNMWGLYFITFNIILFSSIGGIVGSYYGLKKRIR
jgi:hypothetical protein